MLSTRNRLSIRLCRSAVQLACLAGLTLPASGAHAALSSTASSFDSAFCSTVGYLIVRTTGGWACARGLPANAAWWGASPGNSADGNAAAFKAAYAAIVAAGGGTIFIPAGTYQYSAFPWIQNDGVSLQGAGQDATVLVNTMPNTNEINITNSNSNSISDLTLTNQGKTGGTSIYIFNAVMTTIERVHIKGPWNGISVNRTGDHSTATKINNVMINENGGASCGNVGIALGVDSLTPSKQCERSFHQQYHHRGAAQTLTSTSPMPTGFTSIKLARFRAGTELCSIQMSTVLSLTY